MDGDGRLFMVINEEDGEGRDGRDEGVNNGACMMLDWRQHDTGEWRLASVDATKAMVTNRSKSDGTKGIDGMDKNGGIDVVGDG